MLGINPSVTRSRSAILRDISSLLIWLEGTKTLDVNFGRTGLQQPRVAALTPAGDGGVFVHGGFHYVNGVGRPALAKFLADGRLEESFDPRRGLAASGITVGAQPILQPDGKLILYGYPGNPSGLPRLVRLNPDGS
jgi:hypothetical protein